MSTLPDRPAGIKELNQSISQLPTVDSSGLTITSDGQWAIQLWLKPADDDVIQQVKSDILQRCTPYPVLFEISDEEPMRAGPAYPDRERAGFSSSW
ncbi:hypothetical protein [Synechococcus sp. PCC 7336]|uniref:hypothetical protein n=1 Tax=Synechococcus sp. PCC 7336 TaxID=195250 RepID=UPI00034CC99F|nr:hypothetical protein [Synechococcus sp. PCC 7336]